MIEIGQPVIPSLVVTDVESAVKFADEIGYPVIIRPASHSAVQAAVLSIRGRAS